MNFQNVSRDFVTRDRGARSIQQRHPARREDFVRHHAHPLAIRHSGKCEGGNQIPEGERSCRAAVDDACSVLRTVVFSLDVSHGLLEAVDQRADSCWRLQGSATEGLRKGNKFSRDLQHSLEKLNVVFDSEGIGGESGEGEGSDVVQSERGFGVEAARNQLAPRLCQIDGLERGSPDFFCDGDALVRSNESELIKISVLKQARVFR